MDFYTLINIASLAGPIIAIGGVIYTWLTARATQNSKEITELTGRTDTLERRVDKLDTVVEHMPDRELVHRMEVGMEKLSGRLDTLSGKLEPVEHLSRRLQEILLQGSGR